MKRQKGEVITATVVVVLLVMFGFLATNGGKGIKTAEAEQPQTVQTAEAK